MVSGRAITSSFLKRVLNGRFHEKHVPKINYRKTYKYEHQKSERELDELRALALSTKIAEARSQSSRDALHHGSFANVFLE